MGPGLSSREAEKASDETASYTVLNLGETMASRGMPPDTIQLLSREVGTDGVLIVVRAVERHDKIESILVRNGGHLRTAMATEQHPVSHVSNE